jgi:hypothetical protein
LAGTVIAIGMVAALAGCAKPPDAEMAAAKTAVEDARSAGAPQYVPDGFKSLEGEFQRAQDEVKAQGDRFALMRDYDQAKASFAKVRSDAERLKTEAAAAKEKAKGDAETARADAQSALDAAKAMLAKAPRGKGTKADLEAMDADLKAAEASLAEVATAINAQDYLGAKAKAEAAKEKAAAVTAQIEQARMKMSGARKK